MSDAKIIAYITIPAGIVLVLAVAVIYMRADRHEAVIRPVASAGSSLDSAAVSVTSSVRRSAGSTKPSSSPSQTTTLTVAPLPQLARAPSTSPEKPVSTPAAANPLAPPAPFRGIVWGTPLADRNDMVPANYQEPTVMVHVDEKRSLEIKNLHVKDYERIGDKLQFGPEHVGGITYCSFDGRFYKVEIRDPNPYNLSTVFSGVYGPAKESKIGHSTFWEWNVDDGQTRILMSYEPPNDIFPNGLAWGELTNVKLEKELTELQKKEAIAELNSAKKDF